MPPSSGRLFPPTTENQRVAHLEAAETTDKQRGRREHRRLQASDRLVAQLDWPGAAQVCRIVRVTRRNGVEATEIEYALTSVPRRQAGAARLLSWWRDHWGIENRLHYVRDVAFQEDACRIRRGNAPQNLAAFRNALVSLLRLGGHANITAALRDCAWKTSRVLATLGIFKQ